MEKQGPLISPAPPPLSPSPKIQLRKRKRKSRNRTPSTKICVICEGLPYTEDNGDEEDRIHVYVLNLNSNMEISAEPVLRIRYSEQRFTTCVVNSTLYFIEGWSGRGRGRGSGVNPVFRKKSVYFYKLASSPPTTPVPVLDYTTLEQKTAPMNGIKCRPMGIPTPDYKAILVFSKFISVNECVNFELYNLATDKWDVLPELFPCLLNTGAKIRAYAFLDESTFLIQIEDKRTFTLNLKSPQCWKLVDYDMFGGMVSRRFTGRFFGLGNGLVMDFAQIYDINCKKNVRIPVPEESIFKPFDDRYNWYRFRRSMTLLPPSSANESSFCVLCPLPLHDPPGVFFRPRFSINVHHFDPATPYDKSTCQFKANNMKSFKFVLANYRNMHVTRIYHMEEEEEEEEEQEQQLLVV